MNCKQKKQTRKRLERVIRDLERLEKDARGVDGFMFPFARVQILVDELHYVETFFPQLESKAAAPKGEQ